MRLVFERRGFDDLAWWVEHDRRMAGRIFDLIQETLRDPFKGKGKPEPLKHEFAGCWSRRIDQEHRLVYMVRESEVVVLACRFHYTGR